jgi:hypothetical protein
VVVNGHAQTAPRATGFSKKYLDSNDHFERPLSFMAVKGKLRNPNKKKKKEQQ